MTPEKSKQKQTRLRKENKEILTHAVIIFHDKPEMTSEQIEELRKRLMVTDESQVYFRKKQ